MCRLNRLDQIGVGFSYSETPEDIGTCTVLSSKIPVMFQYVRCTNVLSREVGAAISGTADHKCHSVGETSHTPASVN